MLLKKITPGFVVQTFDTDKKKFVDQEFVAGEQTDYETEYGDTLPNPSQARSLLEDNYQPFTMVQPK